MPQSLAQITAGLAATARQLWSEGKHDAAWEVLWAAYESLQAYVAMERLPKSTVTDKLRGDMEAAHRLKLSEARTTGTKLHPMMAVARKKGMTMADLAEALGYSRSMLSRILSGEREMPADKAELFEKLTGKPWRQ